ncbi:phage integrase N-terminal SAM-like domain-containing protein [Nitrosomonas sp. Is37]|uniref:phage integrase N-terminal SAM-like domain-containing protein n=1 Tax=Nitrosomonas sp. Is37 TaxID=3080535 RepID=UPI0039829500
MNKPRLLNQARDKLRLKHYSYRTEQSDIVWIKRFLFSFTTISSRIRGRKKDSFLYLRSFLSTIKKDVKRCQKRCKRCQSLYRSAFMIRSHKCI